MKKRFFLIFVIILIVSMLIFFKMTGFAVKFPTAKISVVRTISSVGNDINVNLKIVSNQHVLAIREVLPKNATVTRMGISKKYEVFEFKNSSNEWIIADRNSTINGILSYSVRSSTGGRIIGQFSYFSGSLIKKGAIAGSSAYIVRSLGIRK